MTNEERQKIERAIVEKIIDEALAQGYAISINNGGDDLEITQATDKAAILENMFATDSEHMFFHAADITTKIYDQDPCFWCYLVYGNDGYDVISDYVVNSHSEGVLKPVEDFTKELERTNGDSN